MRVHTNADKTTTNHRREFRAVKIDPPAKPLADCVEANWLAGSENLLCPTNAARGARFPAVADNISKGDFGNEPCQKHTGIVLIFLRELAGQRQKEIRTARAARMRELSRPSTPKTSTSALQTEHFKPSTWAPATSELYAQELQLRRTQAAATTQVIEVPLKSTRTSDAIRSFRRS
jgi:hypothetical protein